jgi:hypothetical protein
MTSLYILAQVVLEIVLTLIPRRSVHPISRYAIKVAENLVIARSSSSYLRIIAT